MRKLLVVLTAVIALTAASKAMVVWAAGNEAMAPDSAMTETTNNEMMNDTNAMGNEVNAMNNEMNATDNSTGGTNTY